MPRVHSRALRSPMMLSLLLFALAGATTPGAPAAASACAAVEAVSLDEAARFAPPASVDSTGAPPDTDAELSIEATRRRDRSLARLEAIRSAAGAGRLTRSDALARSASRHAAYLSANGLHSTPSIHAEAAGLAGFTGADPFVRMRAAGFRSSYGTEVIGDVMRAANDGDCVDRLMNTVYHAALLLSRVTQVGAAYGDGPAAGVCVIDLGAPLGSPETEVPASGELVRYPWPGMTVPTGTFLPGSENPRPPAALLPGATAGVPVLVGLRNADGLAQDPGAALVQVQVFELLDDGNVPVPSVVLADIAIVGPGMVPDKALHGAFAVLVPRQPLRPGRYRVILHATIGSGHVLAPAPWEFSVADR